MFREIHLGMERYLMQLVPLGLLLALLQVKLANLGIGIAQKTISPAEELLRLQMHQAQYLMKQRVIVIQKA